MNPRGEDKLHPSTCPPKVVMMQTAKDRQFLHLTVEMWFIFLMVLLINTKIH
jgi:hypothetical protein